jgi:hypothetical protein
MWHNLKFTRRGCANTLMAVAAAAVALAVSPVAAANVSGPPTSRGVNVAGCLPLNGTQLTANSNDNTNILGIIYITNDTYWYQDGAVDYHKTVDGGEFNLTHSNIFGAVPAAPGSTVTIPGISSGSPILVTVCNQ